MLKLPTSLFECICFICVNIVSFSSLWGFCSPRLFITVFSQPNLERTKHPECSRDKQCGLCVNADVLSILLLPHYSPFNGLFCSRVLFQHIFNIAEVRGRGQIHHLVLVLKPWKSKLCLWITIHQNKFPLQPPQRGLDHRSEPLLSVVLTLLAMCLICWWAWPILNLPNFFLTNWGIFHTDF